MYSSIYKAELALAEPLEDVFSFFADPRNLQLTPPWLHFKVLTRGPIVLRAGTLIDYGLRLRGFRIQWQSEITIWEPPHWVVDEQKLGPCRSWPHEHRFEPRGDGTLVLDLVRYAPPGGWLLDKLFVRRDLQKVFEFRRLKLLALFGARESR